MMRHPDMGGITDHIALMRRCLEGLDRREGVQAFKDKRAPKFGAS